MINPNVLARNEQIKKKIDSGEVVDIPFITKHIIAINEDLTALQNGLAGCPAKTHQMIKDAERRTFGKR